MNTFEALSAARDAIVKGWTQGAYHLRSDGYGLSEPDGTDQKGERFCSIGSIQHALCVHAGSSARDSDKESGGTFEGCLKYLTHAMAQLGLIKSPAASTERKFSQIINFNDKDGRKKSEVIAAFNKAVSNAKRRHLNG